MLFLLINQPVSVMEERKKPPLCPPSLENKNRRFLEIYIIWKTSKSKKKKKKHIKKHFEQKTYH